MKTVNSVENPCRRKGWRKRVGWIFGVTVWLASLAGGNAAELAWFGGAYSGWPTTWTALPGLNDGVNPQTAGKLDFVGDALDPGAYWAQDAGHVYFRVRMNVDSVSNQPWNDRTYSDTVHVLIDLPGYGPDNGLPDYGFSWSTNQDNGTGNGPNATTEHGLKMTVFDRGGATWDTIRMADIDGSSSKKGSRDINGPLSATDANRRSGDGYLRTIDDQATENFGTTTFVDFAVAWDYLTDPSKGNTALAPGQSWKIALATIANARDTVQLNADIGGDSTLASSVSDGWSSPILTQIPGNTSDPPSQSVPEPSSMVLMGLAALAGYARHRWQRRRQAVTDSDLSAA